MADERLRRPEGPAPWSPGHDNSTDRTEYEALRRRKEAMMPGPDGGCAVLTSTALTPGPSPKEGGEAEAEAAAYVLIPPPTATLLAQRPLSSQERG
jgi:hypothetical protein